MKTFSRNKLCSLSGPTLLPMTLALLSCSPALGFSINQATFLHPACYPNSLFHVPKTNLNLAKNDNDPVSELLDNEDDPEIIVRGSESDVFSDDIWEDIETGKPPQWMVVKELLGINAFTYVLAALIVVSLSLNFFLGPGWLGQAIGWKYAGTYTEVSKSFPDAVDLSDSDYLL